MKSRSCCGGRERSRGEREEESLAAIDTKKNFEEAKI